MVFLDNHSGYIHAEPINSRSAPDFKNHFVATLATADMHFPLHAWHHLIPHAEISLNLLRTCTADPRISAWTALHGAYSFNSQPIAPPGCFILAFDPPDKRKSWGPHGVEGFYLGPALDHYRCHRVLVSATNSIRVTDTVAWNPARAPTQLINPMPHPFHHPPQQPRKQSGSPALLPSQTTETPVLPAPLPPTNNAPPKLQKTHKSIHGRRVPKQGGDPFALRRSPLPTPPRTHSSTRQLDSRPRRPPYRGDKQCAHRTTPTGSSRARKNFSASSTKPRA
mmetsp:Transcript_17892/g.45411  ORF Transcript_17892/g.45411 Transcript_17892/m.45411 type:complete len:280 (+) Transcript_17892:1233-2072(+)